MGESSTHSRVRQRLGKTAGKRIGQRQLHGMTSNRSRLDGSFKTIVMPAATWLSPTIGSGKIDKEGEIPLFVWTARLLVLHVKQAKRLDCLVP